MFIKMYKNVHSCFVLNRSAWKEQACLLIDGWIKIITIYSYHGTIFCNRNTWITDAHDRDKFHRPCVEGENPDNKWANAVWFHFYEILQQTKWMCTDRNQINVDLRRSLLVGGDPRELSGERGKWSTFWLTYMSILTLQIVHLMPVNFIVGKLHFSRVD